MTTQGTHEMEVNDTPSAALSPTRKRVSMSSTGVMQVTDDGGITTDVGGGGGSSLPFTSILYDAIAYPGGFTAEVGKINRIDGTNPSDANLPAGTAGAQIGFYIVGAGGGPFEIEPFLGDTINGGTPELDIERPVAGQFVMLEFSATELDWAVLSNTAQVALPFTTTLYAVPFTAEVNKINRVDGTVPALAIALPLGADGDVIGFLNEYGMNGSIVVTPDVGGPDFIFVPGNPAITINQPPVGAPIVTILRFNGSTKIWLPEDIFLLALSVNPRFIPTSSFDARPKGTAMLDNSLLASVGVGNDIAPLVVGDGEFVGRPTGGSLGSVTAAQARAILSVIGPLTTTVYTGSFAAESYRTNNFTGMSLTATLNATPVVGETVAFWTEDQSTGYDLTIDGNGYNIQSDGTSTATIVLPFIKFRTPMVLEFTGAVWSIVEAVTRLFPKQQIVPGVGQQGLVQSVGFVPVVVYSYFTAVDNQTTAFDLLVQALEVSTGDAALFAVSALAYRDGTSVVTIKNLTFTNGPFRDQPAWDVTLVVSGTRIDVTVTGEVFKTIQWRCTGRIVEQPL